MGDQKGFFTIFKEFWKNNIRARGVFNVVFSDAGVINDEWIQTTTGFDIRKKEVFFNDTTFSHPNRGDLDDIRRRETGCFQVKND